jgi:hypothetical protein
VETSRSRDEDPQHTRNEEMLTFSLAFSTFGEEDEDTKLRIPLFSPCFTALYYTCKEKVAIQNSGH